MGDIDALRKREIPYVAIVDGQGVSIGGTSTLGVLQRRGMESGCQVDANGVAADASTLRQLQARSIQNFCEVTENGIDPISSATVQQIAARGISPRCPVDANGVALTGTSTIDTLRKRGIAYFCPLDENGTATTLLGWVLSGAAVDIDFANSRYFGDTLANLLSVSRASTGYAQTVAGTLTSFGSNVPRITDQGLLIEEARTNTALYSGDMNSSGWGSTNSTIATSAVPAPDPSSFFMQVTASGTGGCYRNANGQTLTSGTQYTFSTYLSKSGTAPFLWFFISNLAGTQAQITVDTSTGAVVVGATSGFTAVSGSAVNVGSNAFRVSLTATPSSTQGFVIAVGANSTSVGGNSVAGQTVLTWGAQLEVGAFPTSYIPTTTISVTRAADSVTVAGAASTAALSRPGSLVLRTGALLGPVAGTPNLFFWNSANFGHYIRYGDFGQLNRRTFGDAADSTNIITTTANSAALPSAVGASWGAATGHSIVADNTTVFTEGALAVDSKTITSPTFGAINGAVLRLTLWNTRLSDATLKAFTA